MKTRKIFTLGVLLTGMCLFVALLLGSAMGIKKVEAEGLTDGTVCAVSFELDEDNASESQDNDAAQVKHTFLSRVVEWISRYRLESIGSADLAATVACVITVIIDVKFGKKNTNETNASIRENTAEMKRNTESNDEVLKAANLLIDSTNALTASDEKRSVDINQLLLFNKAVLEILVTVYANNKNIPQATKDLVTLKYVNALKGGEGKEVSEG